MTLPFRALVVPAAALVATAALSAVASASTAEERLQRGEAVVLHLNDGVPQPALERLREEFPFLADATQGYALGEVWSRPELDDRTRQLAAVAALAATGDTPFMQVHAGYALNLGVSEAELKEIVYLVTVVAGFPRAIAASQALSQLFAERALAGESEE